LSAKPVSQMSIKEVLDALYSELLESAPLEYRTPRRIAYYSFTKLHEEYDKCDDTPPESRGPLALAYVGGDTWVASFWLWSDYFKDWSELPYPLVCRGATMGEAICRAALVSTRYLCDGFYDAIMTCELSPRFDPDDRLP